MRQLLQVRVSVCIPWPQPRSSTQKTAAEGATSFALEEPGGGKCRFLLRNLNP